MDDEIRRICSERGLEMDRFEQQGAVLLIYPKAGSSLPGATKLKEISEAVEIEGIRYIALGLMGDRDE